MARGFRMGVGGGSPSDKRIIIQGNKIFYPYRDNNIVIGSNSVQFTYAQGVSDNRCVIYNIDLTKYTKLSITAKCGVSGGSLYLSSIGSTSVGRYLNSGTGVTTVDVDVSNYSGLNTFVFSNTYYGTTDIYSMVLS